MTIESVRAALDHAYRNGLTVGIAIGVVVGIAVGLMVSAAIEQSPRRIRPRPPDIDSHDEHPMTQGRR